MALIESRSTSEYMLHRTVAIFRDFGNRGVPCGHIVMVRSPSDGRCQRMTWSHLKQRRKIRRRRFVEAHDCRVILANLPHDSGHDHRQLMGHNHRGIVAINPASRPDQTAAKIGRKFPLKRRHIPPFFLTFD